MLSIRYFIFITKYRRWPNLTSMSSPISMDGWKVGTGLYHVLSKNSKFIHDQIVNPCPSEIKKASVQLAIYVIVTLFVASKGRNSTDPALLASYHTSLAQPSVEGELCSMNSSEVKRLNSSLAV